MTKIARLTSENELQAVHAEVLINSTSLVTKISDNSVVAGMIAGNAKTGKKALKDIALAITHLFPDDASGIALDQVASDHGVAARLGSASSTTYVRLIADNGTIYLQGTHTVKGRQGIVFDLEENITIGTKGYGYVKVRSQTSGDITNVDAYTISTVTPVPSGHIGIVNEYGATGGRDSESDERLRQRIKEGPNILARSTIDYLTQAFITLDSDILRVTFEGISSAGKVVIGIITESGITLTQNELDILLTGIGPYLSLTEINPIGTQSYGVELKNIEYQPIDIEFRVELVDVGAVDAVAIDIQVGLAKYVDHRFWDPTSSVEWTKLFEITKNTDGVKNLPATFFTPNNDVEVDVNKLPRFRGFIMRDLSGAILLNQAGTLDPIYYPNEVDESLVATVL